MTPRGTINFFRHTKTGAFLLFLGLMFGGFVLVRAFAPQRNGSTNLRLSENKEHKAEPQVVETIAREMIAFNPPHNPDSAPAPTPAQSEPKDAKPRELAPISLYAAAASTEPATELIGDDYAPFGRLVRCELVITVDSSSIQTPIVGLVTDDVWHNGHLVIPAGTEVHGTAQVDRVRERIASSGGWTLVWQTGEELNVTGLALDREKEHEDEGWGITDGSAGLRGQLLKSDDLAEVKLFAATFLSGAAGALTDKQQTLLGTQALPTLKNAPFAGAQEVLNVYAQQILSTIQRDGFYVRVPAGKQFYLYVTQTIDKSKAVVGGTRYSKLQEAAEKDGGNPTQPLEALRTQLQRRYTPVSLPYAPVSAAVTTVDPENVTAAPEPPLPKR